MDTKCMYPVVHPCAEAQGCVYLSIDMFLTMVIQYLESTLNTLVVATSGRHRANFTYGCQDQPFLKWHA